MHDINSNERDMDSNMRGTAIVYMSDKHCYMYYINNSRYDIGNI